MPKQSLYSLLNPEFVYGLRAVFGSLRKNNVPAALVGGVGCQAIVSDTLSGVLNKSIDELVQSGELSIRENVRQTDDYDIVALCDSPGIALGVVDDIPREETLEDNIYEVKLERRAIKRPVLLVKSLNDTITPAINFSYDARDLRGLDQTWYNPIVESRTPITLRNEDVTAEIQVPKPEYLVAAKLTRNNPRDLMDIHTLIDTLIRYGKPFDMELVKKVLGEERIDAYKTFEAEREHREQFRRPR